jgi:hypothetical protein
VSKFADAIAEDALLSSVDEGLLRKPGEVKNALGVGAGLAAGADWVEFGDFGDFEGSGVEAFTGLGEASRVAFPEVPPFS